MGELLLHILITNGLLLPALASLVIGIHLISIVFHGVPLGVYAAFLFTPYAISSTYSVLGETYPSVTAAAFLVALIVAIPYYGWKRLSELASLSADQRLLGELLLQTATIALCSLLFGPATRLLPSGLVQAGPALPSLTAAEQWAGFAMTLPAFIVFLMVVVVFCRRDRLILIYEDRDIAIRAGLVGSFYLALVLLIGLLGIALASFTTALDRGFSPHTHFATFLYSLAIALLIRPGNYLALIASTFLFFSLRSISIFMVGSWIDDIIALLLISVVTSLVYRHR
jgi:hypothetical protein